MYTAAHVQKVELQKVELQKVEWQKVEQSKVRTITRQNVVNSVIILVSSYALVLIIS